MNKNYRAKIVIHCQYVYGLGHFVRTTELAKGLSESFDVYVFNGGEMVPNFELSNTFKLIQLPAIYKEENRDELIPVDNSKNLSECFDSRRDVINQWLAKIVPDVIITEHFPFGLLFEKEVLGMLEAALKINPNVRTVCSVRDIIESAKGSVRDDYICDLINKRYDLVLIHGDERFAPLSKSFPKFNKITTATVHTGYIVTSIPTQNDVDQLPVILTSVAGGRLGTELLDAIIECHGEIKAEQRHKLVMFSGAFQKDFEKLQDKINAMAFSDVVLNKFDRQKYLQYMSNASLIISLGGYNSLIESVSAQKPLLIYNREFAGSNEEQDLRIKLFRASGYLEIITQADLKAKRLSQIVVNQMKMQSSLAYCINANGVQNSRKQLLDLLNFETKDLT